MRCIQHALSSLMAALFVTGCNGCAPAWTAGASAVTRRSSERSPPASRHHRCWQPGPPSGHRHPGAPFLLCSSSIIANTMLQVSCAVCTCNSGGCQTLWSETFAESRLDTGTSAQVQLASRTPGAFDAPGSVPGGADAICSVPYSAWDLEAPRNGTSVSRVHEYRFWILSRVRR